MNRVTEETGSLHVNRFDFVIVPGDPKVRTRRERIFNGK